MSTTRRPSLRLRITAGSLVFVLVAFAAGGQLVVVRVQRAMTEQVDATLRSDATYALRSLVKGSGPGPNEGPAGLYVQLVSTRGDVVVLAPQTPSDRSLRQPGQVPGEIVSANDPVLGRVRVLIVAVPDKPGVAFVLARSSQQVVTATGTLRRLLAVAGTAGSLLLAVLIWWVVGRALRPVERMRRSVEDLDDGALRTRVELPGTGDELDRLGRTLNDLLTRLDRAVGRERRFVEDASHDLRTPIAALRVLLESESDDPDLAVLTRAEALARLDQLQGLVEQLLVLGALEEGAPGRPTRAVDLDELVLGHARLLARRAAVRIDTSRVSGGQVAGREADLDRLVQNLLSNAVRYAHSTVSISMHEFGSTVELLVDDDGPGIAPADRERVFDRFATLDDARRRPDSGTGLGLAIAAAIVAAHAGTIDITDAPGGGARFTVRLPAYRPLPLPLPHSGEAVVARGATSGRA